MHSESILFYDLWLEYNDYKQLNLKPQSYRKFINNFKNHILPFFGNYRLDEITSKIYIQWLTIIDKQGFKNSFNKNLHGSMVTMFNYALKFGYIDKNIPQLVGGIRKKETIKIVLMSGLLKNLFVLFKL